jgi:hypothetical protein
MKLVRLRRDESCGNHGSARTAWRNDCSMSVTSYARRTTRVARVHVNRMRGWKSGAEENARKAEAGMWPDSRRTLRGILERREKEGTREYKVRRAGRRGYVWVREADLPEVVIKAYELLKEQWKAIAEADVVTHIACARVDIFDHYEITIS